MELKKGEYNKDSAQLKVVLKGMPLSIPQIAKKKMIQCNRHIH